MPEPTCDVCGEPTTNHITVAQPDGSTTVYRHPDCDPDDRTRRTAGDIDW